MLLKLLGWIWIIMGIFFLSKPQWLKSWLRKKSYKKIRGGLFLLTLGISFLLIKAGWGVPGILAKVIVLFGVIGIFKAFFILKAKAAEGVMLWVAGFSVKTLRWCAAGQIVFGAILLSA